MAAHRGALRAAGGTLLLLLGLSTNTVRVGADGGARASPRAFPHQAAVVPYAGPGTMAVCSGSLVAAQWVLTSADCIRHCAPEKAGTAVGTETLADDTATLADDTAGNPRDGRVDDCNTFLRVILGAAWPLREEAQQSWHTARRVVQHSGTDNDLALLQLDKPAPLSEFIRPVRLPAAAVTDLPHRELLLSGWGSLTETALKNLSLQSTITSYVNKFFCQVAHFWRGGLRPFHLCGRQSACVADRGGSALVVREADGGMLLLAQSSGAVAQQCDALRPTLFVRVDAFASWIRDVVGDSTAA